MLAGISPRTRALPIMAGASKYEPVLSVMAKMCVIYKGSILYYQYEIDHIYVVLRLQRSFTTIQTGSRLDLSLAPLSALWTTVLW